MTRFLSKEQKNFFNISSFQILAMFRRTMFYGFLSIYLRFFLGMSVTETTFFVTFPIILNVVFQTFVWGKLSDKRQLRRTLIIVGEISAAITTLLVWYLHILPESKTTAGWIIILGLSFVEIYWSMSNVGWSALLSDLYPDKERAGIQGRLQSIGAVGRIVGVWIGGAMYDGFAHYYEGWGFAQGGLFFIASAAMLISTIPMFFVPEGGIKQTGEKKENELTSKPAVDPAISRKFRLFLIVMVFINFGQNSIALIKSQYLVLDGGFDVSSETLGYIINMASVSMFIAGLFIKRLSDRWRDDILLLWSTLLGIAYLVIFAVADDLYPIYLSNFFSSFAWVGIFAFSYSYAARLIPPEKRGRQFALFNATFFLSWGVPATFIAGPIVDLLIKSGATEVFAYRMSFVAAAILMSVGAVILLFSIRANSTGE